MTAFNFPMTLEALQKHLSESGLEAVVYRSQVEYDEHMIGQDVYLTLECRIVDRRPDESDEESYNRAMKALGL